MTRMRRSAVLTFGIAIAASSILPVAAMAQTTEQPFPRNNVRGSALAARRPGTWTQASIANHNLRQNTLPWREVPITQVGPEPTFRDLVLPALVEAYIGAVNQLSLLIQTLIRSGTLPTI
jgi:hypothetical protein